MIERYETSHLIHVMSIRGLGMTLLSKLLSNFEAAFAVSLFWMAAMTQFELSFAYPFMSLTFVLALLLSGARFGESMSFGKIVGMLLIISGICTTARL
jgi:multidrug transporter EmrE-like cation transporter